MMFEFCKNTRVHLYSERPTEGNKILDSRFENIKSPVPGKRTFHEFSPISECKVVVKRHSEDK